MRVHVKMTNLSLRMFFYACVAEKYKRNVVITLLFASFFCVRSVCRKIMNK